MRWAVVYLDKETSENRKVLISVTMTIFWNTVCRMAKHSGY